MPPLTPAEIAIGFIAGSVTRGVIVGCLVGFVMWLFTPMTVADPGLVIFYAVSASVMLSTAGLITAIWADKYDNVASVTNFIIVPLSFLSGTFYSIDRLPGVWHKAATFNPFFYLIDGFRAGFIGISDASVVTGAAAITGINVVLLVACHAMLRSGYKLKS